ncbi:hypothetical protein NQ318_010154 [Aromia moschata]|uniref:Uncharacterized protein n=1 Tax=Aromia moschata TaxID=1265417 RepID=A0AAV8XQV3_9CUCU|nr:hypothetical protein NQ318_010154 [Aromia moschata]
MPVARIGPASNIIGLKLSMIRKSLYGSQDCGRIFSKLPEKPVPFLQCLLNEEVENSFADADEVCIRLECCNGVAGEVEQSPESAIEPSLFLSPFCLLTVLLSSSFCLLTVLLPSSFILLPSSFILLSSLFILLLSLFFSLLQKF